MWRINRSADYGPLNATARGIVDLDRIRRHWPDMLRIAGSIHTGQISAYDALRVLSTGGNLTQLGEALAGYGRIFKTLHVLIMWNLLCQAFSGMGTTLGPTDTANYGQSGASPTRRRLPGVTDAGSCRAKSWGQPRSIGGMRAR